MFRGKSDPIPPPDVLNDRLRQIGGMSQDILDANRAGRMSQMQQQGYASMMKETSANQGTMMIIYSVFFIFILVVIV